MIKEGQKIWINDPNKKGLIEAEVLKVGTKYLYVSKCPRGVKFDLVTMKEHKYYGVGRTLWINSHDYYDLLHKEKMIDYLQRYKFNSLDINKLECILNIIGVKLDEI